MAMHKGPFSKLEEVEAAKSSARAVTERAYPGTPIPKVTTKPWTGVASAADIERILNGERDRVQLPATATGVERKDGDVRCIFVGPNRARKFFQKIELVPSKDEVRGYHNGTWFWADSLVASVGGWWREVNWSNDNRPTRNEHPVMKKFTERVLAQGKYDELEKIQTPKPGEQFDMNQLAVAAVLTLNKAVEVIEALEARVADLEGEVIMLQQGAAQPANEAPTAGIKLRKLGDSYQDVRESA